MAMYIFVAHKKGISSVQLGKDIGVRQGTAWFMLQRLREVMGDKGDNHFNGVSEVDETYIGGKEKNKHIDKKFKKDKNPCQNETPIFKRNMNDMNDVQ